MSRILIDTHAFLWLITGNPRFSRAARKLYQDPGVEIWLSYVSVWEIVIKHSLGKLPLPQPPHRLIASECTRYGIGLMPLNLEAIYALQTLPFHHNDPFDRLLIAQALVHEMTILTEDRWIKKYKVKTVW